MRLDNTRLLVGDCAASFRFYHDLMGFTTHHGSEGDTYVSFDTGGGLSLALFQRDLMAAAVGAPAPTGERGGDQAVLVFEVENVDAAAATLRDRGVAIVAEPQDRPDWGIRTAHVRDVDGNLIEIYHDLARA